MSCAVLIWLPVLVVTNLPSPNSARKVAENLARVVSQPYDFNGHRIRISASIGAAGYPEPGTQHHELLRKADLAMDQAREAGTGTWSVPPSGLEEKTG